MSSIWTIRRSATDAKASGLCGGVARHWGVDPVLVRVGFALLALSGGLGLVLYLAGWLLIPVDGKDQAPVDDLFGASGRRWPREIWVTLVVVACLIVLAVFGSVSPFGVGPALVLAVIWYFGFYRSREAKRAGSSGASVPIPPPALDPPAHYIRYPGPPTPFTQAADAWGRRLEENARQAAARPVEPAAYAWPTPPAATPEPRLSHPEPAVTERSAFLAMPDPVGLYTEPESAVPAIRTRGANRLAARRLRLGALVVIGLALSVVGVLDWQGVRIPVSTYFGAALLVVGLTLIAATWLGRARGLLPVGALLAAAVLVTSSAGPATGFAHWPSPDVVRYTSAGALPADGDTRTFGTLRVDLSALQLTADAAYRAHVDAGRLDVTVPADVNVVARYHVGVGVVRAFTTEAGGTELTDVATDPVSPEPSRPTLTLDLSVDQGDLQVGR